MQDLPNTTGWALPERFDYLLKNVHPPYRGPYTLEEVAEGISEQNEGFYVSIPYLSQLRTGARSYPTIRHVTAIARFFQVPVTYFLESTQSELMNHSLSLARAVQAVGVHDIALRAAALSPSARLTILRIIDEIQQATSGQQPPQQSSYQQQTAPALLNQGPVDQRSTPDAFVNPIDPQQLEQPTPKPPRGQRKYSRITRTKNNYTNPHPPIGPVTFSDGTNAD
ncbi:helix-turn-helix domain-containing protein [Pseudonocardia sp. ICBG601]|uniref:helix-turn-helix domain-containing protein n=1 Tax=Pseudonocardia sp. ICBG601 TaxID=2846759 RepID=UPI001CF6B3D6|nr:helix-turn-helix transcriptional regulator [Pseudonocardia sp. ICBG601]